MRPKPPRSLITVLLACSLAAVLRPAPAPSPCYGRQYLVAGKGWPGAEDGPFLKAGFRRPAGLALSTDGRTLYVADSGNTAVRAVHLDLADRVTTVCTGRDAGLAQPVDLALDSAGQRLLILDSGDQTIKAWDLRTRACRVLFPSPRLRRLKAERRLIALAVDGPRGLLFFIDAAHASLIAARLDGGLALVVASHPALGDPEARLAMAGGSLWLWSKEKGRWPACYSLTYDGCPFPQGFRLAPGPGEVTLKRLDQTEEDLPCGPVCGLDLGGQPALAQWVEERGLDLVWPLKGNRQRLPLADIAGAPIGVAREQPGPAGTSERRIPLRGAPSLLWDADRGQVYVSEAATQRIIGLDVARAWTPEHDPNLFTPPSARTPHERRLLMIGDSMLWLTQGGPEAATNPALMFPNRLEHWLAVRESLTGGLTRWRVWCRTHILSSWGHGPVSTFLKLDKELDQQRPDEVMLQLSYMNLWHLCFDFHEVATRDDLPKDTEDLDWYLSSAEDRARDMGPLARGLRDAMLKDPKAWAGLGRWQEDGRVSLTSPRPAWLKDPRFRAYAKARLRRVLRAALAHAKAHHIPRVSMLLLPTRDLVETGELTGNDYYPAINPPDWHPDIRAACRELGLPLHDLTPAVRLAALPNYPLICLGDHHYTYPGQDLLARCLARELVKIKE